MKNMKFALVIAAALFGALPLRAAAQGIGRGAAEGAAAGGAAAGPVGSVVGGAVGGVAGGVAGGVKGVLGVPQRTGYRYYPHRYYHHHAYYHHYRYHRHYGYGYGGARWCRSDPSPRDPLYFKRADNRCTGTIRIGMGR
jgi:hypothetical protein